MVRPLSNQENLRVNEYAGRVQKTKAGERGSSRDFSYEFRDAVHEVRDHRQQQDDQPTEDSYEHSEDQKEKEDAKSSADKPLHEKDSLVNPDEKPGPLDIVV